MQFDESQLQDLIRNLELRYKVLHTKVQMREAHFGNLDYEGIAPKLPPPFDNGPQYQTDLPRHVWSQLKARICENHFTIIANPPKDSGPLRKSANALERYFTEGLALLEERQEIGIQDGLSDGQIVDCYGVLHWTLARDIWPDVPEPEYLEYVEGQEPPEGYDALYDDDDEPDPAEGYVLGEDGLPTYDKEGMPIKRKLTRYKEGQASVNERYAQRCAEAGFPWMVEHISPDSFMALKDRSTADGFALVITRKEVALLTYIMELEKEHGSTDKPAGSVHDVNPKIPIYGEQPAPVVAKHSFVGTQIPYPSDGNYGQTVSVYEVWTRDEFYEICVGANAASWTLVKSDRHVYGMPPFALAPAQTFISTPDLSLRYLPALEGVFRLKPFYDRQMSLMQVIAEQIALPYYYWKNMGTGAPLLDEKGRMVTFTRDSANAEVAPEGYELAKVDFELNPAFVEALKATAEQIAEAAPAVGKAEITGSTQPWAIRLQQAQESVEPGRLMAAQERAIRVMVRNMAKVQALSVEDGGLGTVYVYGRANNGEIDKSVTEEINPEDIQSLNIDVAIENRSAAEQITLEEHGRQLLDDANVPLTKEHWASDYAHWEDADQRVIDWRATLAYEQQVEPGQVKQLIAKQFSQQVVMGVNGQFVGYNGQQLTPGQVLQMNGQQPTPQPPQAQPQGVPSPNGGQVQPTMPSLPAMAAPGTIPLGGQPG